MGDRTYVTLTVLAAQEEAALAILTKTDGEPESTEHEVSIDNVPVVNWGFEEVNYGDLNGLEALSLNGIAFTSSFGSGDEYSEGEQIARFTPAGEIKIITLYESSMQVGAQYVLTDINEGRQAALVTYLTKLIADHTPLPLDEKQVEYGKIYATLQMVNATTE